MLTVPASPVMHSVPGRIRTEGTGVAGRHSQSDSLSPAPLTACRRNDSYMGRAHAREMRTARGVRLMDDQRIRDDLHARNQYPADGQAGDTEQRAREDLPKKPAECPWL